MNEKAKLIKEYLPIITIIVSLIAFLEKYFYYQYFKIPIYNYLAIEEYVTIAIEVLAPLILMALIGYSIILSTTDILSKLQFVKNKNLTLNKLKQIVFISAIIPTLYLVIVTNEKISYVGFFYIGYLLAYKWDEIKFEHKNNFYRFLLLITLIANIYSYSAGKYRELKTGINQDKIKIVLKSEEKIYLGCHFFKIGETKDYLFIYSTLDNTTRVITRNDIKDIFYSQEKIIVDSKPHI